MSRSWLLVCAAVIGCGTTSNPGLTATTGSNGLTGSTVTTTDASSSSTASSSSSSTSESPPTTTADTCPSFICEDQDLIIGDCDVFAQDCPEGEKCAAVITEGSGVWNYSRCVPVTGSDMAGDPCISKSVADGLDSCVKGAMCWGVDMDGNGTCIALCMGTPEAATCTNGSQCTIALLGVLNLCFSQCDPLLQDCPGWNMACYPAGEGFLCGPNPHGPDVDGDANAVCEFQAVCDPGLECGDPEFVGAGCPEGSPGCCTPFCEFPDGPCPNPDQQCVQWYDPKTLPPEDPLLKIGACGLPP